MRMGDFIWAQGNKIIVADGCKQCGCKTGKDVETKNDYSTTVHRFYKCDDCGDIHYESIRAAKESYPHSKIEIRL